MDDMQYEQYGASMGYQPMDKQQGNYINRSNQVSRYVNMQMEMENQGRIPNQQQINMIDQQKPMPGMNSMMGDRNDDGYKHGMMQNGRNGPMGMNMRGQKDEMGQLFHQNSANYGMGATPKQTPVSADAYNYEMYNSSKKYHLCPLFIRYRFFPNAFSDQTSPIGNYFYALPMSFLFPSPAVSAEQIKQFSTNLLLYIFFSMPEDRLQVMAAMELCSRDYLYHKIKGNWYRKGSSNYASSKCVEVFDLESFTFVSCEEEYKNRDFVTVSELQECLKKAV